MAENGEAEHLWPPAADSRALNRSARRGEKAVETKTSRDFRKDIKREHIIRVMRSDEREKAAEAKQEWITRGNGK